MQNFFLNQLRINCIPVTIYLVNGFQVRGHIIGFDQFTLTVQVDKKQQLIFKHAVSTLQPDKPMSIELTETPKGK